MADITKLRAAANRVGSAFGAAAPQSGEAQAIGEKQKNIKSYMDATSDAPAPVAPPAQNVDKVNKNAKFGDKKGEKRISVDDMLKPLGSYKKGTPHVPETGVYKLHEGEAVIPAEKNPYATVPGRKPRKAKKVVKHITTRKAKGGYIAENHHTEPGEHPMEEHVLPDMASLQGHMEDHMGSPEAGAPDAEAAPEPQAVPQA